MRKSNNYNKFLEYIAFGVGGNHGDAVCMDNGVLECVAEARVEDLEGYSKLFNCKYGKMAMDSDTWLKFKVVLVNEEVIEVYYVADSHETHIDTFVLDNFRTQKEVMSTVHQKVVEFFLNSDRFCKSEEYSEAEETEETEEAEEHDRIKYLMDTHSLSPRVTINDDCMKTVLNMEELLTQRFGNTIVHKCKMYNNGYYGCPADRQGNRCCGEKWCAETWKRYEAIINPEWHHVSLNTLANLDFDMLDEKRQTYFTAYRDLKQTLSYLRKCKKQDTYDTCFIRYTRRKNMLWAEGKISDAMWKWIERKLSMQNVESGVWASKCEDATGHHESRRYNKSRA